MYERILLQYELVCILCICSIHRLFIIICILRLVLCIRTQYFVCIWILCAVRDYPSVKLHKTTILLIQHSKIIFQLPPSSKLEELSTPHMHMHRVYILRVLDQSTLVVLLASMHGVVDLSILYAMHSYQLVVDHFQRKPQRCTKLASSVSSDDTFYYNGYTVDYLGFPQPAQLKRLQFRAAPVSRQPQNHSADDISLIYTSGPNGSSSRSSHKIVCVSVGIYQIHLL